MDVSYEQIRASFEKVRHYFSYDLKLLTSVDTGGNYITGLLICCACEILSRLEYGKEDGIRFFAEEMLPVKWRPVAPNLFDAMRNGIAHFYETKSIHLTGRVVEIYLSWRKEPHLLIHFPYIFDHLSGRRVARESPIQFFPIDNL